MLDLTDVEGTPEYEKLKPALIELKRREKQALHRSDLTAFANDRLKVLNKRGQLTPYVLNKAQIHVNEKLNEQKQKTGKVRALVPKARQLGISTLIGARFYHRSVFEHGLKTLIMTHLQESTDNLFEMVERFHEYDPDAPKAGAHSAKELVFADQDSRYQVTTAGQKDTGVGQTIQNAHLCLDPETPVIDGRTGALRRLREIRAGDYVRTHTGAVAKVSFVSRQNKETMTMVLRGLTTLPLVTSPEHRFWTRFGWRETKDLRAGDVLGFPVAPINATHAAWAYRLPDSVRPQGGGTRETGPDKIAPSYELGRIVGLYLAEGCMIFRQKTRVTSSVCFGIHEKEVHQVTAWLDELRHLFVSYSVRPHKNSKTVSVVVHGRSFATFLFDLCGYTHTKRLPINWNECGAEFCRGMAHGYLYGDAHFPLDDRMIVATSIRSAITVGMRDVLASLGYGWAGIANKPAGIRCGRNEKEAWILTLCGSGVDRLADEIGKPHPPRLIPGIEHTKINDGYAWVPIRSITPGERKELIDIEVDHPDHSYCIVQAATHNSEFALWDNAVEHMAAFGQAIPDLPGTEVIIESTGRGIGNLFYQKCMDALAGNSEYIVIFVPWYWDVEYRRTPLPGFVRTAEEEKLAKEYGLDDAQLTWRRNKIASDFTGDESLFRREYPSNIHECFTADEDKSFIPATSAQQAQSRAHVRKGPLRLGVDPSGSENASSKGDPAGLDLRDDNGVIFAKELIGSTSMSLVGEVVNIVKQYADDAPADKPELKGIRGIYVDVIGAGAGVVGRLKEIPETAHLVRAVNVANTAFDETRYAKVRTELYGRMRDWLPLASIKNGGQALMVQICSLHYTRDSRNRPELERKDDAKKRGVRSPNLSDALALTFAEGFDSGFANDGWKLWTQEKVPKCESIIRCGYFEFDEMGGKWALTEWGLFTPDGKPKSAILLKVEDGAGTLSQFTLAERKVWGLDKKDPQFRVAKDALPDFLVIVKGGKRDAVYRHLMREGILCKRIRYDSETGPQVFGETIDAGRAFLPDRQWALRVRSDVARYPAGERPFVVHSVAMALLWLRWMGQVTAEEEVDEPVARRVAKPIYG